MATEHPLLQFLRSMGASLGNVPQAAMEDVRRAPQIGREAARYLWENLSGGMMGGAPGEMAEPDVQSAEIVNRLPPDIVPALARTLRGLKTPLRQSLTQGPEKVTVRANRYRPAGTGAYREIPGAALVETGVASGGGTASPAPHETVLRHELMGHALPNLESLHPAVRQLLMRYADQGLARNPRLESYAMEQAGRLDLPTGAYRSLPPMARTEGLAWPLERSLRSTQGMGVTPEHIFDATDALRRAAALHRAARRNPDWAMSLGPTAPPSQAAPIPSGFARVTPPLPEETHRGYSALQGMLP